MSKDETCSGFHPDAIDKQMREAVELGEARALPRPAVPASAREDVAELDDLIRWTAELARKGQHKWPASAAFAELHGALRHLGAARALVILGVVS